MKTPPTRFYILKLYSLNTGTINFIRDILLHLKPKIIHNTVIVGDFKIPLSPVDNFSEKANKQINRETIEMNDIISQMDLPDNIQSLKNILNSSCNFL